MQTRVKRVLAMLMVFALSVGLLPAGILANPAEAAMTEVTLTATITRTENEVTSEEATPDEATPDEPAADKQPAYTYTLSLKDTKTAQPIDMDDVSIKWFSDESVRLSEDGAVLVTDLTSVKAVVEYDGIRMTLATDEDGEAKLTVAPAEISFPEKVTVGVPFEAPAEALVEGAKLIDPDGTVVYDADGRNATDDEAGSDETAKTQYLLELSFEPDAGFEGSLKSKDGKYYATVPGTITLKQFWRGTDGEIVYCHRELSMKAVYPKGAFYIDNQLQSEKTDKLNSKTTVTLKLENTEPTVDTDCLPTVSLDGAWTVTQNSVTMTFADLTEITEIVYGQGTDVEKRLTVDVDVLYPEIYITKTPANQAVATVDEIGYYDEEFKYTIVATDKHLDTLEVTYQINGTESGMAQPQAAVDGTASYEITLKNGEQLSGLRVIAKDTYGNETEHTVGTQIVDTVDPSATLTFSENVVSVHVDEENKKIFLILDHPIEADSGVGVSGTETIDVTFTVSDYNLDFEGVESEDYLWDAIPGINTDSSISFTKTLEVPADECSGFALNMLVADMAGHTLKPFDVELSQGNMTVKVEDGKIGYDIIVDRRRPGSEKDEAVPTIAVNPTASPVRTVEGKDFFDKPFDFLVKVSDFDSGLRNVNWSLNDHLGAVISRSNGSGDVEGEYTIAVTPTDLNGVESNVVILKVDAMDNVGNTTHYEKVFALDTLNPRLTVTATNQDVSNGCFLNKTQTIIVEVEDLNFDPDNSKLSWSFDNYTAGPASLENGNWVLAEGNTWRLEQNFSADGDYDWNVAVSDLSNRTAADEDNFVIDTVKPVVNVTLITEDAEPKTFENVDYYSEEVTVKVEITDVNLDSFFNGMDCDAVVSVEYLMQGSEEWQTCQLTAVDSASRAVETVMGEIVLKDGDMLEDIRIVVKDNAGHTPENIENFKYVEDAWKMDTNPIVVDVTAPTGNLSFSENVVDFHLDDAGKIYLILDPTVIGESGVATSGDDDVTVTFTTTDRNIKLNAGVTGEHFVQTETGLNQDSELVYTYTTEAISADGYLEFALILAVEDLAGNPLESVVCEPTVMNKTVGIDVDANGQINEVIAVDRKRPVGNEDEVVPTIKVTTDLAPVNEKEGKDIYNGAFTFDIEVFDQHSGLRNVKWSLTDEKGAVVSGNNAAGDAIGKYDVAVEPTDINGVESDVVTLEIEAWDHVGNCITYEKVFILDTQKPRVAIDQSNKDVKNGYFFNAEQIITVTVEDLTFDPDAASSYVINTDDLDNSWTNVEGNIWEIVLEYKVDGDYTFEMAAKDLALNEADVDYTKNKDGETLWAVQRFVVDMTAPSLKIDFVSDDEVPNIMDGVDYYSENVRIEITVADVNLNTPGAAAWIKYTLKDPREETGSETEIILEFTEDLRTNQEVMETILLEHGQVLTDLKIYVIDSATNQPEAPVGFAYNDDGAIVYSLNHIAVDTEAPVITVEKQVASDKKFVQTHENVDYYNGDVTYRFTVEDKFLFLSTNGEARTGDAQLQIIYQDRTETVDLMQYKSDNTGVEDQFVYEYTVKDAEMVKDMILTIRDNAGNQISAAQDNLTVIDADKLTGFAYGDGKWTYTGNALVVDSTVPTAKLTFSDNVVDFYTNGDVVYVVLKTPTNGDSAVAAPQGAETVKVYFETKDLNLALNNGVSGEYNWVKNCAVNTESTLSFTYVTTAIPTDNTNVFSLDLTVIDLAGNPLQSFNSDPVGDNIVMPVVIDNENGAKGQINYQISVDRRRPTSLDPADTTLPTIVVTPSVTPVRTTPLKGDLELFGNSFSFNLKINDGVLNESNSGVQYVKWTLADPNGAILTAEKEYNRTRGDNSDITIPVTVVDGKESNEVTLTVVARDFVGNTITYVKNFAVDKQAPRVAFHQTDKGVENTRYFKNDQIITITVTDLNFDVDVAKSFVNNTGKIISGWETTDNMNYKIVVSYNTDGEYTYAAQAMDRAGNTWAPVYTDLVGEHKGANGIALTIDKTDPVITVTYSNSDDNEVDGVHYYKDHQTVTVQIAEKNFSQAGIVKTCRNDDGTVGNFLNNWGGNGINHTSSHTFKDGNRNYFTITYTDLSGRQSVVHVAANDEISSKANGNSFVSGKFTVDTNAPSIKVKTESMENNAVNIVSDELVLEFEATDPQGNLSDDVIFVVDFMGGNFQENAKENPEDLFEVSMNGASGTIKMKDIPHESVNDGVYRVNITVSDRAGNQVALEPQMIFSLNRFGSTYVCDEKTAEYLKIEKGDELYRSYAQELVITEYNPNKVFPSAGSAEQGALITLSVNGKTTALVKDVHYTMSTTSHFTTSGDAWNEYTYTILESTFKDEQGNPVDGEYTILFYSEDEAGRKNTNESNAAQLTTLADNGGYSGKINFYLDSTKPVATVIGLEDGEQYMQENLKVQIDISDSTGVDMVIKLGDKVVPELMKEEDRKDGESWYYYDVEAGHWVLNIARTDGFENLNIQLTDAAGLSDSFPFEVQVTENLWELYIANPIALISTAVGVVALAVLIIVLISKRKKKKAAAAG